MTRKIGSFLAALVLAGSTLLIGQPAQAKPVVGDVLVDIQSEVCGEAILTFTNTTKYLFVATYNTSDGQAGNISIDGRYGGDEVDVKTMTLEFPEDIGDTTVVLGVFQGAEQENYPDTVELNVGTDCLDPTPTPTATPSPSPSITSPTCVDINQGPLEELMTIEDIDETLAQRIIDARPIQSVEDIDVLPQIGEIRLGNIVEAICKLKPSPTPSENVIVPVAEDGEGSLPETGSKVAYLVGGAIVLIVAGGAVSAIYYIERARRLRKLENGSL